MSAPTLSDAWEAKRAADEAYHSRISDILLANDRLLAVLSDADDLLEDIYQATEGGAALMDRVLDLRDTIKDARASYATKPRKALPELIAERAAERAAA